ERPHGALRLAICDRYRRLVRLGLDLHPGLEVRERDSPRLPDRLQRELQHWTHRRLPWRLDHRSAAAEGDSRRGARERIGEPGLRVIVWRTTTDPRGRRDEALARSGGVGLRPAAWGLRQRRGEWPERRRRGRGGHDGLRRRRRGWRRGRRGR